MTGADASGNSVSEAIDYEAFGTPIATQDGGAAGSLTASAQSRLRYAFTGQLRDPATTLQHHRARWLATRRGQWVSHDPVFDFPGNMGFAFLYCGAGPTCQTDMLGLNAIAIEMLGVGKLIGGLTGTQMMALKIAGGAIIATAINEKVVNKQTLLIQIRDENLWRIAMEYNAGSLTVRGSHVVTYWLPVNPADYRFWLGICVHILPRLLWSIPTGVGYKAAARHFAEDIFKAGSASFALLRPGLQRPSRKPIVLVSASHTSVLSCFFGGGITTYRNSWLASPVDISVYTRDEVRIDQYVNLGFLGIGAMLSKVASMVKRLSP